MQLAVISDIHANLTALEAVLQAIEARGVDAVYCLGDIVGYGPEPEGCLTRVQERCAGVVAGNHDLAVALGEGIEHLPADGRAVAQRHHTTLPEDQRAYLAGLPLKLEAHGCTFVHATPDAPGRWMRTDSYPVVRAQFAHFRTAVCFAGHSHLPAVTAERIGALQVRPGGRFFINVGSVGQPRDRNPNACVGFFDTEAFSYELVRVPYDVERTASLIVALGLPAGLAQRVRKGS